MHCTLLCHFIIKAGTDSHALKQTAVVLTCYLTPLQTNGHTLCPPIWYTTGRLPAINSIVTGKDQTLINLFKNHNCFRLPPFPPVCPLVPAISVNFRNCKYFKCTAKYILCKITITRLCQIQHRHAPLFS